MAQLSVRNIYVVPGSEVPVARESYLLKLHPLAPLLRLGDDVRCVVAFPAFHVLSDLVQENDGSILSRGLVFGNQ